MKVRGTLTITKNLVLPGPNGTVGAQGLVAISDSTGSLYWGRSYVLDVNESLTYRKGVMVMVGQEVHIAIDADAPGALPLNPLFWLNLGDSSGGTELTQAQLDAINGANSASGSNPFATLADVNNLTLLGTDTIANILSKDASPPNNMWMSSDAGFDSFGDAVVAGDGLVSDGTRWITVGLIRGPQGEDGPPGAGTEIVGSDTVANILLKDAVAGENTLWIATDDGIDDASNAVVAGDGLVSDGADWLGVGAIRGPQGEQGEQGEAGESEYSGTYLIKGGIEHISGYTYRVTADKYVIVGILYSAPPIEITLGSADPVLDRTDTFVANYAGIISVKTGSISVNEAIEVRISYVEVKAGTTVDPTVTKGIIYDEQSGGEWAASVVSAGSASIDLAFTGDSVSGTKSTRILNGRTVSIEYVAPGPVTIASEFSVLTFRMKSLLTTSNAVVTMALYNGGAKASSSLNITDFGYDYTNSTDWQYISMYVNYLGILTSTVDKLMLSIDDPTLSGKSEFLIDDIQYQHGVYMPPADGAIPEYTSQLINNGETGASPYVEVDDLPGLQAVLDIGNTSTTDIILQDNTSLVDIRVIHSGINQTVMNSNEVLVENFVEVGEATALRYNEIRFIQGAEKLLLQFTPITADRVQTLQDASGIIALLSDIPSSSTFIHTQGVSATTWNIAHNLNKYPSVTVVDTGKSTIDAVVTYVDENNVTITVNPSAAGYAYIN
jgi:hypothetical protein